MKILVRVGLWHDGLAIQLNQHAAETIEGRFGHMGVNVGFLAGRTIYIEACEKSKNHFRRIDPSRHDNDTHRCKVSGAFNLDLIARCLLHPVMMDLDQETGAFMGDIAPDHELPWPQLYAKCKAYYGEDEVYRQIMIRRKSAIAAGIGWPKMPRIPTCFLDLISVQMADRIVQATDEMLDEHQKKRAA